MEKLISYAMSNIDVLLFNAQIQNNTVKIDLWHRSNVPRLGKKWQWKQVKPIGFEAPRGGAYNNRKHLKLEIPCS